MEAYCFTAYAEALEVIPTTLAENAGLNPIAMVTELRNRHALGERSAGINVRKVNLFFLPFPPFPPSFLPSLSFPPRPSTKSILTQPKKGVISNILEENVLQPLLVSTSAIELATETVGLLLRIDDYHPTR